MPQLDFSVFPSQLFWLALSFFTMLFIMSKFIIPKTAEMIDLRKAKIDSDLEKADEIKQHVEETLQKYNNALQEASAKANVSLQKTKEELNETISRRQADLYARLKADIEAGEKKIDASKAKAMVKVEENAAVLAVEVLKKLGFGGVKVKDAANVVKALDEE